jgi:uncharacterized SAM-binding protein YcdF (DUF218 family)
VKLLASLLIPSTLGLALLALGLLALTWRRSRHVAGALLAAGAVVILVFSSGFVAAALMAPLEYEYPRLSHAARSPSVRHIVVLTGWAADDPAMPLSGRLNSSAAYRVLLALELHRERPDCDVLVSGDEITSRIMGEVLVKLGLPAERLRLENRSTSTAQSFVNFGPMLKGEAFFLVTSAGHMPRSMEYARRLGLTAIAAPTEHQQPRDWYRASAWPEPSSLWVSDLAVHEYLARAWLSLRGGDLRPRDMT